MSFFFSCPGPNAGEMMMSVLWYYRPEQTEMGKQPHIHGEVSNIGFLCLKQPHIHGEVSNIGFLV